MTGGDGFRPFLLEKMAITKQKQKKCGRGEKQNRRESQIWREEGRKEKTGADVGSVLQGLNMGCPEDFQRETFSRVSRTVKRSQIW